MIEAFSFEKNESVILTGSAQSHKSVLDFSKSLNDSRLFDSAKIRYTRKKGGPTSQEVTFEIICSLSNKEKD